MKNMKEKIAFVAIAIAITLVVAFTGTWLFLWTAVTPGPGQEAVLIHKPILFGAQGIDPNPVKTGRQYVWFTSSHILVNMQPQQMNIQFDDLMTKDGVPIDFDSVIRLQVLDSVKLITLFGEGWYDNNLKSEFMNRVRQSVRMYGMNETAINTTSIQAIDTEVSDALKSYIERAGLPIVLIDVTVGKANPPDSVKNQRIDTAKEEQRIQTEKQRKLAEDSRQEAEGSRANADNEYRNKMGLSPDQFLQLEKIKMMNKVCPGGKCIFIDGKATPLVNTN